MRKINSFRNCKPLFGLFFLIMSIGVWGQNLATFNFNSRNLNPVGGWNPNYLLNFYNSDNSLGTASYDRNFLSTNYWTYTRQENTYYELSLNTGAYEGIQISFDGELGWHAFSNGTWSVYVDYGDGNGYGATPIAIMNLENFFSQDSDHLDISFPAAANYNSNWKVKFVAGSLDGFIFLSQLRMDNLVISHGNLPRITVDGRDTSNNWTNIIEGASAETYRGTYFGMVITNPEIGLDYVERNFKINNTGNIPLDVTGVSFGGDAPSDFSISSGIPVTVPASSSSEFTVRFNPSAEGVRNALLNIYSNASPSPFTYYVEGRGASCQSGIDPFRWYTNGDGYENVQDNLPTSGTINTIWGTSRARSGSTNYHQPFQTDKIYRNNGSSTDYFDLFTTSNRSFYINSNNLDNNKITFGSVPVNTENGIEISFNLSAVSRNSGSRFTDSDYITLEVLKPGTTDEWSKEIRIYGGGGSILNANNSRYSFDQGSEYSTYYSGLGDSDYVINLTNTNATKYGKIILKIPTSENFTNLSFRISGVTNNANKLWLIDDVFISSESKIFKTYTSTGWQLNGSPTSPPNKQEKSVIDADLTINSANPLVTCECEINPGKNLIISGNGVATITGKIINNGVLEVRNDGNLIQIEDNAVNSGEITVEKLFTFTDTGTANDRKQYNFVISPVVGQNIKTIYPGNSNEVIEYRESDNYFYNHNGDYTAGKGLAIKEPSKTAVSGTTVTANFRGVPFNGELIYPLARTNPGDENYGFNLIGNPYPSNLDIKALYDDNSDIIESTFFFWDNRGNTQYTQQGSDYQGANYAIYNAVSGTGKAAGGAPGDSRIPNRYVKVGTGFMVQAISPGQSIRFTNAYRSADNSGPAFFGKYMNQNSFAAEHAADINTENENQKDRYWLTLTTMSGMEFMNAVVYFDEGNNEYAADDSDAMGASDEIFTLVGQQYLAINGRAPFENTDVVPLGVRHFAEGKFIIDIHTKEGVFANGQKIYLKDKYLNVLHDLTKGAYGYESEAGEFIDRFEILYKKPGLTNTALTSAVVNHLKIFKHNQDIVLESSDDKILGIEIFNLSGTSLYKRDNINSKEHRVFRESLGKQILIINLITEKGELVSRKFINN